MMTKEIEAIYDILSPLKVQSGHLFMSCCLQTQCLLEATGTVFNFSVVLITPLPLSETKS